MSRAAAATVEAQSAVVAGGARLAARLREEVAKVLDHGAPAPAELLALAAPSPSWRRRCRSP